MKRHKKPASQKNVFYLYDFSLTENPHILTKQFLEYEVNLPFGSYNLMDTLRQRTELSTMIKFIMSSEHEEQKKETKGKVVFYASIWNKTHNAYLAARSGEKGKKGRFVSPKLVKEYVLSHNSVRMKRLNGKFGNSNKSQYLSVLRSVMGMEHIPLSERHAVEIYNERMNRIKVTPKSTLYLYGEISFIQTPNVEEDTNSFGSPHMRISDLFDDHDSWYEKLDYWLGRIDEFIHSPSIKITYATFNVVVRKYNVEHKI